MSGNTNENGMFSVTCHGRFNLNGLLFVCPTCGADQGLVFSAFVADRTVSGRCPHGHVWDEPMIHGGVVRDIYRANTGR